ncbi:MULTISPECIES: tripartite tricarboxylate transporter permease [Thermus]|jgi:TctA family transporter|uniref:C4-dicarboxylate ABC transporter permease n=1 Tax=Thermus brockianus TaxID=56956 RepID=A0A1J0LPY6_THEBO|nr:tripartite tricarboxylate transporter permease [Thermus brockianus]APD08334.1 Tripartite tricarboxylate transporter TctA family protein [Thermus brockianus]BDG16321.1 C4-dicarboxylate ABC transporter permease [Thermus brockianus]
MSLLSPEVLLAMFLGGLYGAVFGALPGLTATLALSLFIPFALFLPPEVGLAAIISLCATAIFAGDIGAVMARIPGTPASAAYTEEIHELGKERGPAFALGLSALPSALGGLVGTGLLVVGSWGMAALARQFSSFEYFWLVLLGVTSGVLAAPHIVKGLVAFALGMLLATVGYDPALGNPRFTFGNVNLLGGINFIVALIGLFGLSEVLFQLLKGAGSSNIKPAAFRGSATLFFLEPFRLILRQRRLFVRSSLLGTFIGFLPGAGSDFAAWIASNFQRLAKGSKETVVLAGASSNNAAVAGTWIPALSLGLPGDTLTAIVLGLFLTLGIRPGPELFARHLDLVVEIYGVFLLASVLVMPLVGYLGSFLVSLASRLPRGMLLGGIAGLSLLGAYAINNNPFDLYVLALLGILGLLLRLGGYPLGQVVLGMVLGPLLEQHLMVSMIKTHWNVWSFFERPVAMLLALVNLLFLVGLIWLRLRQARRLKAFEVLAQGEEG